MSLWQRMKALFVTPVSTNPQNIHLKSTNVDALLNMECENPQQEQTLMDLDTSQTVIKGLSQINPCAHYTMILKCIYCHDVWTKGIRCDCGAVYHDECAGITCETLGCRRELQRVTRKQKNLLFRRPLPERSGPSIEDLKVGPIPQNVVDRLNNFILRPTYGSLKDLL